MNNPTNRALAFVRDMRVSLRNGKYEIVRDPQGRLYALRYGEAWRDLTGDHLFNSLLDAYLAQPGSAAKVCTCPSGDGSLRWPCPQHAEVVEALPGFHAWLDRDWPLWRNDEGHPSISRLQRCWEAALAARPAAVGAVIEVVEQREAEAKRLEPDAKGWTMGWVDCANGYSAAIRQALATQPQQLAGTGVLGEVHAERQRQESKWGQQNHPDFDQTLLNRESGCSPERMAEEYEIPTANRAKFLCEGAFRRDEGTYGHILIEEVAEAFAEIHDKAKLRTELIQCAAVAVAWVEKIDRDTAALPHLARKETT